MRGRQDPTDRVTSIDMGHMRAKPFAHPVPDVAVEFDLETRLFKDFAHECLLGGFIGLDRPARKFPAKQVPANRKEHLIGAAVRVVSQDHGLRDSQNAPLTDARANQTPPGNQRVIDQPADETDASAPSP